MSDGLLCLRYYELCFWWVTVNQADMVLSTMRYDINQHSNNVQSLSLWGYSMEIPF
jgi:hypothetical protein